MINIEKNQRFSRSHIWHAQRSFYDKKGADAWAKEVPFYITSNPFIANAYAKIIISFIKDCRSQGICDTFYLVELGAGPGLFSFYLLNQLTDMAKALNWQDLPFCYVMTDFTEKNIEFWQSNPELKKFLDAGSLDFAKIDIENDSSVKLIHNGKTLLTDHSDSPLIVIANYLFDSIVGDIFQIKNGKLYESLVSLSTTAKNLKDGAPKNWKQVKISHAEKLVKNTYYSEPHFDSVLFEYKNLLKNSYFNFPSGSLRGIAHLNKIAHGKMLLLSSDKGFVSPKELDDMKFPELDFHGSFSLMVNYDAICAYFEALNGDAFLQTPRGGLTTNAFVSGFKFDDLPLTNMALNDCVDSFSPTDYFNLFEYIEKNSEKMDLEAIAGALSMSRWDPYVFMRLSSQLTNLVEKQTDEMIDYIFEKIERVAENFYFVPGCDDVLFAIGVLFYAIDDYTTALYYYHQSLNYFPEESAETYYNIGLCHFYEKRYKHAINYFEKSLEKDPKSKDAKNMLKSAKRKK